MLFLFHTLLLLSPFLFGCSETAETTAGLGIRIEDRLESLQPGQTIRLRNKVYSLNRTVVIRSHNVTILGDENTILRANTGNFHLFEIQSDRVRFESLRFQGAATGEDTRQYAIYTDIERSPGQYGEVVQCRFEGGPIGALNSGIRLNGAHDWKIRRNTFAKLVGITAGRGYGILLRDGDRNTIYENLFVGQPFLGRHAIYLSKGSSHNYVSRNEVTGYNSSSIAVSSYGWQDPNQENVIAHNLIQNQLRGPDGTAGIEIYGKNVANKITHNTLNNIDGPGILVRSPYVGARSTNLLIDGNRITQVADQGVALYGSENTLLTRNHIKDVSCHNENRFPGILVRAFGNVAIANTSIIKNSIRGTCHRAAITLDPTTPQPKNVSIYGNQLEAGPFGAIESNGVAYDS